MVANEPTSHDAAGNLTGIGQDAKVRGYRFDGLSRLVGSVDPRVQVEHALDPLGRPIEITGTDLRPLRMLWDGERLAATLDREDKVEMRFVDSGTGLTPEAVIKGDLEYLLVTDHLGSVRAVIDAEQGNVVQAIDYDALGRTTMNTAPGWQPFGFAGGLHEPASGLIRFRARAYDPFIGRFLSRDPLGFAGGQVNLYQYALGDPVNNVDPTGLRSAPSGEVGMCQGSWNIVRPLAIDYDYLTTDSWRQGMQPTSSSNALERRMARWTMERHRADEQCRKINRVDMACLDNVGHGAMSTNGAGGAAAVSAAVPGLGLCADGVWQAFAICESPLAWEFQTGPWKTGPSSLDSMGHAIARVPRLLRHGGRELKTAAVRIVDRLLD
jgi:RHS repeat-associated protein